MTSLFRRIRYLLQRRRFDRELAADLAFHREMAERANGPQAVARVGSSLRWREEAREAWGWTWIDRSGQDLRYAARLLRRSPAFTATAVLLLALGIGVNVALFSFFNLLVLRPLPVRDPARLLHFLRRSPQNLADNIPFPAVAFYRRHVRSLSSVLAVAPASFAMQGEEKKVSGNLATANFFSDLGASPEVGRLFNPVQDEKPGAAPVAVLSDGFWRRRFAADPSIVGRLIHLNAKPVTIVGVVSPQFSALGLSQADIWLPITQQPYLTGGTHAPTDFSPESFNVQMWGRLAPGATPAMAEQELQALAAELRRQHPADIWDRETLPSQPGGYARRYSADPNDPFYPLFALAGLLSLLILVSASSNLGSLLLARGVAREHEVSVRFALGAGRARLFRQFLTESVLLALLASAVGLFLGYAVLRSLMAWSGAPAWLSAAPDWRVALFAISIGFLAALLFGFTPALQLTRQRLNPILTRRFLIAAQVAASCILLVVSGLLLRALHHASFVRPGFAYQRVITLDPGFNAYSPAAARAYLETLEARLRQIPGITSIALASNPPLGHRWTVLRTEVAGRAVHVHFNNVTPSFFETMQIRLLSGRLPLPNELNAVVVSQSLARLQWPSVSPLGKTFRLSPSDPPSTVVGVSANARLVSPEDSDAVEVYRVPKPDFLPSLTVLIATASASQDFLPAVLAVAKSIDPKAYPDAELMQNAFREKLRTAAYTATAVSLLGAISLLLACLGIVGLVAYTVAQRRKEIGIRLALGAAPGQILSLILQRFSQPVLLGLLCGIAASIALSHYLRSALFGVSNLDPVAYLSAAALFLLAVAAGAWIPARRALRVDPLNTLRYD